MPTCKICGNTYVVAEVHKKFGSIPVKAGCCTPQCYTTLVTGTAKTTINSVIIKDFHKELKLVVDTDPLLEFAWKLHNNGHTEADVKAELMRDPCIQSHVYTKLLNHIRDIERCVK